MSNFEFRTFEASLAGPAVKRVEYSLLATPQEIVVAYRSHEPTYLSDSRGFCEGLWKFDCGELFLLQPSTGRYLEINLAPNGAWWSCVFSGVRERDGATEPPRIEVSESEWSPIGWKASFVLPMSEVVRCLGSSDNIFGNITAILGGCPDKDVPLENLHTIAPLEAVDFHRPHEWVPLEQLET